MTRIDWLVLKRLSSRIGATVFIFYGLLALAESLFNRRVTVGSSRTGEWSVGSRSDMCGGRRSRFSSSATSLSAAGRMPLRVWSYSRSMIVTFA